MKTLSPTDMIDLLPVGSVEADRAARQFESLAPANCRGDRWLSRSITTGETKVEQIQFNGVPIYLFWWHKSVDNGLWIDGCQSYNEKADIKVAFAAASKLQYREGCSYVRFMTIRQGLAKAAESFGYVVEGLILCKQ